MPSKSYRLSPMAERDLEEIWLYTCRTWSAEQADVYHGGIIAGIEGVAAGTRVGRDAGDVRAGYRKLSVSRHTLYYREGAGHIDIVRVLHQRMDAPAHLGPMDS